VRSRCWSRSISAIWSPASFPSGPPCESRPQRNAYHRFTVDRHLWEAAANAAALTHRVTRPDLLVLGALFHDLGKGYPGDHTEVGMDLVRRVGPKLGLAPPTSRSW
jgi:[protein-PII] uridylyltransferase